MYQIICDNDYVLYDSRSKELQVIEPKCDMELNKTGTLSFKIPPNHPYYGVVKKLKSEISLYQDGEWLFSGRVLNDEIDFRNFRIIEVEGELGYLLDSIQKTKVYHESEDSRIKDYLTDLIAIHNSQVDDFKKFEVGNVTVTDKKNKTLYKISSYENTLTLLNNELIDVYKGYIVARNVNGVKYIDYLTAKDFELNEQIIEFGKNLINLKQYLKGEEIATCIIPLGETVSQTETEEGDTVETKLDLSSVDTFEDGTIKHDKGTDFIYDSEAVEKYGKIYKVIDFGAITETKDLVEKAKEQLNYYKLHEFKIELNAYDLHLLDVNYESIKLGQKIRVISLPHGLNAELLVSKISINLTQPDKTTITLSSEERTAKEINTITKKTDNSEKKIKDTDKGLEDTNRNLNDNYVKFKDLPYEFQDLSDNAKVDLSKGIQRAFDDGKVNLSEYAKIVDVNSAFNELATLLEGV